MRNTALWIEGLRPRTLPASLAPVLVGGSCSWAMLTHADGWGWGCVDPESSSCLVWFEVPGVVARFSGVLALCLAVALFLQLAVNFANDYSDGIRGVDSDRGGSEDRSGKPQRLTASGLVSPRSVLLAAGVCALIACVCGMAVVLITGQYWLTIVGVLSVLAGWFYTGGRHPYGYAGWGELFVFVFFGLIATLGTQFAISQSLAGFSVAGVGSFDFAAPNRLQDGGIIWFMQGQYGIDETGMMASVCVGLYSVIILMVNNLRDIDEDRVSGKRTLAVHVGKNGARILVFACQALVLLAAFPALLLLWDLWGGLLWLVLIPFGIHEARAVGAGRFRAALGGASGQLLVFTVLVVIAAVTSGSEW